jgi:hypothetical protein
MVRIEVLGIDGTVDYTYNPHALGESDPNRGFDFYTGREAFKGTGSNDVTLFKGSPSTLDLNLVSGTLADGPLAVLTDGYVVRKELFGQRFTLMSETQLRVRRLSPQ